MNLHSPRVSNLCDLCFISVPSHLITWTKGAAWGSHCQKRPLLNLLRYRVPAWRTTCSSRSAQVCKWISMLHTSIDALHSRLCFTTQVLAFLSGRVILRQQGAIVETALETSSDHRRVKIARCREQIVGVVAAQTAVEAVVMLQPQPLMKTAQGMHPLIDCHEGSNHL